MQKLSVHPDEARVAKQVRYLSTTEAGWFTILLQKNEFGL